MRNILLLLLITILAFSGTATADGLLNKDTEQVVDGNTEFALDLYSQLKKDEGNLFFSPYSISMAVSMAYAGARGNTEKQIADVFHLSLEQDKLHPAISNLRKKIDSYQTEKGFKLNVANALWAQKDFTFLTEYLDSMDKYYDSPLHKVDFIKKPEDSREEINQWVEDKTNEKIKDLIPRGAIDALTRLILVNAIYFKGSWSDPFIEQLTKDKPFWITKEKSIDVPIMGLMKDLSYGKCEGLKILKMGYERAPVSMVVLLPDEIDGLKDLEENFNKDNLDKWISSLSKKSVTVYFPKFKMTSQFALGETVKAMGMPDAFDMSKADFSGLTGKKDLYISKIIHKAFVEVDEKGTEAAAATAVIIRESCVIAEPLEEVVFKADHPFLFLIRDDISGSILFLGRVKDPLK